MRSAGWILALFVPVVARARGRVLGSDRVGNYVGMEFELSPGGRPVSVQVRGTDRWVDLKGDPSLRTTLGLRSTLVRTARF